MPIKKKNQKPDLHGEPRDDNEEFQMEATEKPALAEAATPSSLTADLASREGRRAHNTRLMALSAILGLVLGLVGGIFGAIFIVPWYQVNVLHENVGEFTKNEKKIILDEESAVISAVEKVEPAVVSIVVSKDLPKFEQLGSPFGDFFFDVPSPSGETEKQRVGAGSGFFISDDGLIVTNKHVVDDAQAEYTVVTKNGKKLPAKVLATDPFNDLAILQIAGQDLPHVILGDSDNLKLGQRVIAIGNALGEFQNTVTTGVVSGIGRNITAAGGSQTEKLSEVIQTDAAINPGNSGGPLINLSGEVIGVNTALSQAGQLIGFAIPINPVKKVINDVKEFGKVRRPFLGVRYTIVTESYAAQNDLPVNYGALIVRGDTQAERAVLPGSPAAAAGLQEGDIILELDGEKITLDKQLADLLRNYNPGDRVVLKVLRDGQEKTVMVTLGEAQ